jgi:hypothetical protein
MSPPSNGPAGRFAMQQKHPQILDRLCGGNLPSSDPCVRVVDCPPRLRRGSCCDSGPVIYVIERQLDTEQKHGRMFNFKAGVLTCITTCSPAS